MMRLLWRSIVALALVSLAGGHTIRPVLAGDERPDLQIEAGGLSLEQLEAEDNTNCASSLSNVRPHVTYTAFDDGPGPIVR